MYIKIHTLPDAKTDQIIVLSPDTWQVSVRAPAKQNLANKRILESVAAKLGLPAKSIRMVSGHRSRSKIISVLDT